MIIAYSAGGRTGNQVFHFLYLLAAAHEYDLRFNLIAFKSRAEFDIAQDCEGKATYHPMLMKLARVVYYRPVLRKIAKILGIRYLVARESAPSSLTERLVSHDGKCLLMDCWPYIDFELLRKHEIYVRNAIQPSQHHREKAEKIIRSQQCDETVLVGVHIRRTDYKEWQDGRYFYDLSVYERLMQEVAALLDGKVRFIICSDEQLEKDNFCVACRGMVFSHEDFMTDYALLSLCDYTMGPPSSFRMTSSFLGNTPTFSVYSADQHLTSMAQFALPLITP